MHLMRESWTDARLDDLNLKVDRLSERVDRLSEKVDRGFERIDDKFDALHQLLVKGLIAIVVALIGGFATVLAAIVWA